MKKNPEKYLFFFGNFKQRSTISEKCSNEHFHWGIKIRHLETLRSSIMCVWFPLWYHWPLSLQISFVNQFYKSCIVNLWRLFTFAFSAVLLKIIIWLLMYSAPVLLQKWINLIIKYSQTEIYILSSLCTQEYVHLYFQISPVWLQKFATVYDDNKLNMLNIR